MKIAVIDDYEDVFRHVASFGRLKDHAVVVFRDTEKDVAKLAERLKDAEAVVLTQQRSSFPRALIERLPKLKLIAQPGGHQDHIDSVACTERGIVICGGGSRNPHSTAELSCALMLASVRHIPDVVHQLKQGRWQPSVGSGLHGKTLGIYALGRIGGLVAQVGKAFGMKVMCWGRAASQAKARDAGYEVPASRAAFFENADIISLHIKLNPETRGIITAADLARMKPTALLVNTSRALLIEEGALVAALRQGRPGFAAVDVYEDEPVIGSDHPLLKLPNVIGTPHIGYAVQEKFEDFYGAAIEGILAFAAGKPVNVLNPEVLGRN